MDLYIALREIGIDIIKTIKAGFFSVELLAFSGPSDKIKTYGLTKTMFLKKMKPLGLNDIYKRGSRKNKIRNKIDFKNRI